MFLVGLVGVSVKQKLAQNIPRCNQTARSLIQLHRRDPSNWLTYQHLNFLKRQVAFTGPNSHCFHFTLLCSLIFLQLIFPLGFIAVTVHYPINHLVYLFFTQYVAKSNSELHQRAIPKQAPVLTIVDERDDSVERQVQRVPAIDPVHADPQPEDVTSKALPEISTLKAATEDAALTKTSMSSTVGNVNETPHVHVETEKAREARLDRQWKQLKLNVADLPDIYARLAKIKLTGRIQDAPFIMSYDTCK